MVTVALVSGLAGLWAWVVLNDEEGVLGPVHGLLLKTRLTRQWMMCPWCSGAWFSAGPSLLMFHQDLVPAVITALASAAITGLIGSYIQGE